MSMKAVVAALSLACWLGLTAAESQAIDLMKDVKKAEHAVSKDFKKVGSSLKKGGHSPSSAVKKGTKKLKIHKPKF